MARTTKQRHPCKHPVHYETDWLGRTYAGCPICHRWKLMKPAAPPPEPKRRAA